MGRFQAYESLIVSTWERMSPTSVSVFSYGKWSESLSVVSDSLWPHGLYSPWNSPGQSTGLSSLSFLQGILTTQGLSPGLLHCRRILYQLSHKESPWHVLGFFFFWFMCNLIPVIFTIKYLTQCKKHVLYLFVSRVLEEGKNVY